LAIGKVATRLGEGLAHDLDLAGEAGGGGGAGAEEPVAEPDRAAQGRLGVRAEPDRGMRLLGWLGLHGRVGELPELSVEGH
jgi:hypothetical protein